MVAINSGSFERKPRPTQSPQEPVGIPDDLAVEGLLYEEAQRYWKLTVERLRQVHTKEVLAVGTVANLMLSGIRAERRALTLSEIESLVKWAETVVIDNALLAMTCRGLANVTIDPPTGLITADGSDYFRSSVGVESFKNYVKVVAASEQSRHIPS